MSVLWIGSMAFLVGESSLENYRSLTGEGCKPAKHEVSAHNPSGRQLTYEEFVGGVAPQQSRSTFSDAEVMGYCDKYADELRSAAKWTIGPPLGLLALGFVVTWVVAGFRRP